MANIINQINVGGTTYDVGAAAANVSVDPASAGVESTALEPALKEIPDNTINKYNANNLADNLTTGTAGIKALDAHQGSIIQTQTNNIMDIVYGKTTRAYAAGDFFMLNNKPYCASTTIAVDTTLTDSTVMNYATLLSESATNVLAGQIAQINKTLNDKIVSNSEAITANTNNISKNKADITALNSSLSKRFTLLYSLEAIQDGARSLSIDLSPYKMVLIVCKRQDNGADLVSFVIPVSIWGNAEVSHRIECDGYYRIVTISTTSIKWGTANGDYPTAFIVPIKIYGL